jgi:tetratricopeptide (TPR) repeat protein
MKQDLTISVMLVLAVAAAYWPAGYAGFVDLDDPSYVSKNEHVAAGLTWDGVRWAFTQTTGGNWNPMTWLSHMADGQLFGLQPRGHHLMNVGWHAVNSVLLFLVLRRMTAARWASAAVAGLFALHPLHVESVAWVSERKDVLSAFFWILTMWAYVRYAERPGISRYVPVFVFLAMGLMAKPMPVTLPFVLLLLDFWPLNRMGGRAALLRLVAEKVPLFALVIGFSVVAYIVQQDAGAMQFAEKAPLPTRCANALVAYACYLGKMVWPAHLAAFYPYRMARPLWQPLGSAALLVAATALVTWQVRRRPYLAVGWFWYVGTLVPVIGLVQIGEQSMADRYTYVPLIGIFIAIAWLVADVLAPWRHRAKVLAPAGAAVLTVCAVLTARQAETWMNSKTLFEHALAVTTDNGIAHGNFGNALLSEGNFHEAGRHYAEAVRIKPDYAAARNNLAAILMASGRYDEAVVQYREAIRLCPTMADAWQNWGCLLLEQGRSEEAIARFREALRLVPDHIDAHKNMGVALVRERRYAEALGHLREAFSRESESVTTLNYLAWILAAAPAPALRNPEEAVRLAERARDLSGGRHAGALDALAAAYAACGRFAEASQTARRAAEVGQAAGLRDFAADVRSRLALYEKGQAFLLSP